MADNNEGGGINVADTAAAAEAARTAEAEATRIAAEQAETARLARLTQEERDQDMVSKLVKERIEQELAPIKANLDKAYAARDAALKKNAEFEAKEREATLKKLEEDGKHKEAFELRLAEERATNEALKKQNTELSRDVAVRDALKGYIFRNDRASDMAFKEIVANLVQNEAGHWVHRSGITVKDYCEAFSRDEEQSFLFKAKVNTGGGSNTPTNNGKPDNGKVSLFSLSQEEVLKRAAAGKL
jgi:hypothetical protein